LVELFFSPVNLNPPLRHHPPIAAYELMNTLTRRIPSTLDFDAPFRAEGVDDIYRSRASSEVISKASPEEVTEVGGTDIQSRPVRKFALQNVNGKLPVLFAGGGLTWSIQFIVVWVKNI
jgi:hypothetical protein